MKRVLVIDIGGTQVKFLAAVSVYRSADFQSIRISRNRRGSRRFFNHGWTRINTDEDEAFSYPCPSVFIRGWIILVAAWPRWAVSPICNRQGAGGSQVSRFCRRSAGYKPAIQQTTSLRYEGRQHGKQILAARRGQRRDA